MLSSLYLVSMLFADLLSLHLVTLLMFYILVYMKNLIYDYIVDCITKYSRGLLMIFQILTKNR